jgi:hypothetical protein
MEVCENEKFTRLNRDPIEWEKIFAIYISGKGLITRKNMELKKLNSLKIQGRNGQMN